MSEVFGALRSALARGAETGELMGLLWPMERGGGEAFVEQVLPYVAATWRGGAEALGGRLCGQMLMRGARSLSLVRSLALRGASVEALERVTPALLPALAALEIEAAPGTERAVGAALERMAGQLERVTLRGQIGAGLTCLGAAGPLAALDLGGAVLDAASEAWLEAEGERGRLRALGLVGSSVRGWRLGQLLGGASRWPGLERLAVRAWDRRVVEGALEAVRVRAAGGLVGLRLLCAALMVARWPDALDLEEVEVESCSSAPLKIERVVSARTRRLVMHPARTSSEVIEAPALEEARLWGADRALVDVLARTPLPRLRRLSLCAMSGALLGGDAFSGLYGSIQWPSLTELELGGGALRLHELGALCRSPLAGQLEALRLRFIGDNDGWSPRELMRVFEPHREQLRALRRLEIAGADAAAVRRAVDGTWLSEVLCSRQHRP